jgi:branched-chain amino acid transport system ATP-binding protein
MGSGRWPGYVMETDRIVHSGSAKQLIDDPEVRRAYLDSMSGPGA